MPICPSLPEGLDLELRRVVRRWQQLSADHACVAAGPESALRTLIDDLARRTTERPVPNLGPASAIDQLKVVVWDAHWAGVDGLTEMLAQLRRALP